MFPSLSSIKQEAFREGVRVGRAQEQQEANERKDAFRRIEQEYWLNTPVIIVPNEWTDPIIGFVSRVECVGKSTALVVFDELRQKEMMCGGVLMGYSNQRLQVALDLDPYQLWAITAHNNVDFGDFDKPKSGVRQNKKDILRQLDASGFFERVASFETKRKAVEDLDCRAGSFSR